MGFRFGRGDIGIVIDYTCSFSLLSWGAIGPITGVVVAVVVIVAVVVTAVVIVVVVFRLLIVGPISLGVYGGGEGVCLPMVVA